MAKHSPRFQKLCDESKARVKETTVDEVKRRLDGTEPPGRAIPDPLPRKESE